MALLGSVFQIVQAKGRKLFLKTFANVPDRVTEIIRSLLGEKETRGGEVI